MDFGSLFAGFLVWFGPFLVPFAVIWTVFIGFPFAFGVLVILVAALRRLIGAGRRGPGDSADEGEVLSDPWSRLRALSGDNRSGE